MGYIREVLTIILSSNLMTDSIIMQLNFAFRPLCWINLAWFWINTFDSYQKQSKVKKIPSSIQLALFSITNSNIRYFNHRFFWICCCQLLKYFHRNKIYVEFNSSIINMKKLNINRNYRIWNTCQEKWAKSTQSMHEYWILFIITFNQNRVFQLFDHNFNGKIYF